ncbi:hypothetical protein J6590_067203 [Homalodisca vitripennis]|nr:hypothetical protein J6590_067203 [Homalodisca vitripennis]
MSVEGCPHLQTVKLVHKVLQTGRPEYLSRELDFRREPKRQRSLKERRSNNTFQERDCRTSLHVPPGDYSRSHMFKVYLARESLEGSYLEVPENCEAFCAECRFANALKLLTPHDQELSKQ